jgi:hypothetical protein
MSRRANVAQRIKNPSERLYQGSTLVIDIASEERVYVLISIQHMHEVCGCTNLNWLAFGKMKLKYAG